MHRRCLSAVGKASVKRQALVFTDSDSLVSNVEKDVGQSHDKWFGIVASIFREGFLPS